METKYFYILVERGPHTIYINMIGYLYQTPPLVMSLHSNSNLFTLVDMTINIDDFSIN